MSPFLRYHRRPTNLSQKPTGTRWRGEGGVNHINIFAYYTPFFCAHLNDRKKMFMHFYVQSPSLSLSLPISLSLSLSLPLSLLVFPICQKRSITAVKGEGVKIAPLPGKICALYAVRVFVFIAVRLLLCMCNVFLCCFYFIINLKKLWQYLAWIFLAFFASWLTCKNCDDPQWAGDVCILVWAQKMFIDSIYVYDMSETKSA